MRISQHRLLQHRRGLWMLRAALAMCSITAHAVAQTLAPPVAPQPAAGSSVTPAVTQGAARPATAAPTQVPLRPAASPGSVAARRNPAVLGTPRLGAPVVTTTENPIFQPAVVPVSPTAQVTVPVVSTVPQVLPPVSPAAASARSRATHRAGSTPARPAAVAALATPQSISSNAGNASVATTPDPPPPYPLAARAPIPEPTDPGVVAILPIAVPVPAPLPPKRTMLQKLVPASPNIADNSLNSYVERLRRQTSSAQPTTGAIWAESGRLTRLNTDVRAMRPNDLIQVVVLENLAASTDGTVKNQRASAANSSISSLIGALHASNALQNLVNQSSSNSLNATGASATNSSLSTTFGGQVIEVLPNGMLVIEAARQVEFSQQTQTIILRGLVRPEDISQENQVISTAISSLELQVKGKGIVNDYTRRQNPLVRLLQQILIF